MFEELFNQEYTERIRKAWPTAFQRRGFCGGDVIVLASEDLIHQDTIGKSNCDSIADDLYDLAKDDTRPYVREVYVPESAIHTEEDAIRVEEVLEALDDYPLYHEEHYLNLEHNRLLEYMEEELPGELSVILGIDESDELMQWIVDNQALVWEFQDGSVDDYPFNAEAIAESVKV